MQVEKEPLPVQTASAARIAMGEESRGGEKCLQRGVIEVGDDRREASRQGGRMWTTTGRVPCIGSPNKPAGGEGEVGWSDKLRFTYRIAQYWVPKEPDGCRSF